MTGESPSDLFLLLRFLGGCGIVLALLGALAFGLRWAARRGWIADGTFCPRGRLPARLKTLETLPLDAKRRLVLVSCDENAYLLLLGPDHALVVASYPPTPPSET